MRINPVTKDLFSDEGHFIKHMHCPYNLKWDGLKAIHEKNDRRLCEICDHEIIDTETLSDSELISLLKKNAKTCLKIDLNQKNVVVTIDR